MGNTEGKRASDIIPIVMLDSAGNPTTNFRGSPCISIRYSFTPPVKTENGWTTTNLKRVWALLDTGADWNLIDSSLIPADSPALDQIVNTGIGGEERASNHRVWFHLDTLSLSHATGIIGMTPRSRPYQIILGRKFLQCAQFIYNMRDGHSLTWMDGDHAE